jgi:hypothetical protein
MDKARVNTRDLTRIKNDLNDKLRNIDKNIERSRESIHFMRSQTSSIEFYKTKIKDTSEKIKYLEEELNDVKDTLGDDVKLQQIIDDLVSERDVKSKKLREDEKKKVKKKKQNRQNQSDMIQKTYQTLNSIRRTTNSESYMNKRYSHFLRITREVPPNIKKRLSNMYDNECLMWRGVCIYGGKRTKQKNTHVVHIKEGENFITHYYKRYNGMVKQQTYTRKIKEPKRLISEKIYPSKTIL